MYASTSTDPGHIPGYHSDQWVIRVSDADPLLTLIYIRCFYFQVYNFY